MQSLWNESVETRRGHVRRLGGDLRTTALVVGGGLAGVLCAHRLAQAGVRCVLVEQKRLGAGATGHTTGKITAQHRLIYADLIRRIGAQKARQYYDANQHAVGDLRALAAEVPCDFEEKTAYVYSRAGRDALEREARAYRQLGIPHHLHDTPPLPFAVAGALGMEGQAQFNPMKLLVGLAGQLEVYEDTPITKIEPDGATTPHGRIRAQHIVLATHYPMVNIPGLYFMKLTQQRSYVLALEGAGGLDGMYIDAAQDGLSFRTAGELLLVGGGGHPVGKPVGQCAALRTFAQKTFPAARERFAWAAQDCISLDGTPYIGMHRRGAPHLYVATGFNKWGMAGAMVSANLICEFIANGHRGDGGVFSPQRSMLHRRLFTNLATSAANLVRPGKRCSHMGCALRCNAAEQSWDCPCHGSRFGADGAVLDNPALKGIKP